VATPLLLVVAVAVVDPPLNVPLAALAGVVKVTVAPLTGLLLAFRTVAASAVAKLVLTVALCGVPAVAVMLAGGAEFTVSVKLVVCVLLADVAVTVMVDVPAAAAEVLLNVNVELQVGLQDVCEKDAVTPLGSPDAEKETA